MLIVVVAARISEWITKGETPYSYLNPGGKFSRIAIISLCPDEPEAEEIKKLCGNAYAEFYTTNLMTFQGMLTTLFIPQLIKKYINKQLNLSFHDVKSVSVRAYGDTFAGTVAAIIGKQYGYRSVASIHTCHLTAPKTEAISIKHRLIRFFEYFLRRYTHKNIDFLAPVYSPAVDTIPIKYRKKTVLIPNSVGVRGCDTKRSYVRKSSFRLITVGRLIDGKSIFPILNAIKNCENLHLTVVGDGPNRFQVEQWIEKHNMSQRVTLIPRMQNIMLIEQLKNFDAFIAFTLFAEVPKTVIEAGLVGLPIVLNEPRQGRPVEYKDASIVWCSGTPQSFRSTLIELASDEQKSALYGQRTKDAFKRIFDPATCNEKIYHLLTNEMEKTKTAIPDIKRPRQDE